MKTLLLLLNFILIVPFNECEDLLAVYGQKTEQLTFLSCTNGTGQVIKTAKYKVAGKDAKAVEQFLIDNYQLGKLQFTCCGWEPKDGKNGQIRSKALEKINPNYVLEVTMFANAEKINKQGEYYLEKDRTKIDFSVEVNLLDI